MEVRGQTVRAGSLLSPVWILVFELRLGRCPALLSHLADPIGVFYELGTIVRVLGVEAEEIGV